jgi:ABC-type amino acid transport substrate-binding protein
MLEHVAEYLIGYAARDDFIALCRDRWYLAVFPIFIAATLLISLLLNQALELNGKLAPLMRNRKGRIGIGACFVVLAMLSVAAVLALPRFTQPTPEFTLEKSTFVGEPIFLKWKYDRSKLSPSDRSKTLLYQLKSDDDPLFKHDPKIVTLEREYHFVEQPENGKRYWTVRAYDTDQNPLSDWSAAVETTAYKSAYQHIVDRGSVTVFVSNSVNQGIFKFIEDGRFGGFDIALITAVAKDLPARMGSPKKDFGANITPIRWAELLDTPRQGRADMIISTITKRQARVEAYNISFSNTYYCTTQSVVYLDGKSQAPTKDMLDSSRVGVPEKTTSEDLVNAARSQGHRDIVTEVKRLLGVADAASPNPSIAQAKGGISSPQKFIETDNVINAVLRKDIDYGVVDTPFAETAVLRDLSGQLRYMEFDRQYIPDGYPKFDEYAIAVGRNENELLVAVNAALENMKQNGTLEKLVSEARQKYLGKFKHNASGNESTGRKPWECPS